MGKKILIIEDDIDEYHKIKNWIDSDLRIRVIPNTVEDIQEMLQASKCDDDIKKFVEKQIRMHYQDLVLILCDLMFIEDIEGGRKIVEHIRQLEGFTPSNWATIVPIIGMTRFATTRAKISDVIKAGADYGFDKEIITKRQKEENKEKEILKAIIDTKIKIYRKNVISHYPPKCKDEIIKAKTLIQNKKTAFIISSFRYDSFITKVEDTLKDYSIIPLVANIPGGRFSSKLWEDIIIHTHVCDFGIAIFADDSIFNERDNKERDKMNPNVNIEVGYMLSEQKEVLFLKHDSLTELPSDFKGEQYAPFENEYSLKDRLKTWLELRGFTKKTNITS